MSNNQQRNLPSKPPLRGGGGQKRNQPSRPPVKSQQQQSGGGNNPVNNRSRSNRGRGGGGGNNRGRGRGRGNQRGRGRGRGNRGRGSRGRGSRGRGRGNQRNQQQYINNYQNQNNQMNQANQSAVPSGNAPPSNTNPNQQQVGGQPARRPPMKQNNAMFAQFENAPNKKNAPQQQQQQQQQQPQQQQPAVIDTQPQVVDNNDQKQESQNQNQNQQQQNSPNKNKPQPRQPPISAQTGQSIRRQPPWVDFTGKDKPKPVLAHWAHRVRQVLSGDTVRISLLKAPNQNKLNPAKIMRITLDGIRAPMCQRLPNKINKKNKKKKKNKNDPSVDFQFNEDEPFAFEAREFVRNFVMNKNVFYAVWRILDTNNNNMPPRYYGDIYVQVKNKRQSLSQAVIEAGLARVNEKYKYQSKLSDFEFKKLKKLQDKARDDKKNIWSYDHNADQEPDWVSNHIRSIEWIQRGDENYNYNNKNRKQNRNRNRGNNQIAPNEIFAKKYQKKKLKGVVDQVINGSTIRVELFINDGKYFHVNIVVNIAGVLSPKQYDNYNNKSKYDLSKFANQAKEWTSERLLGQSVEVQILFAANRNVYAQILHPGGRIGPSLLKKGLAEYESWTAKACDDDEQKYLKTAFDIAQKQKINIWSVKPPGSSGNNKSKLVTVIQIISGDTLVVKEDPNNPKSEQQRYTLSSIRCPKLATKKQRDAANKANKDNNDDNKGSASPPTNKTAKTAKTAKTSASDKKDNTGAGVDKKDNTRDNNKNNNDNNNNNNRNNKRQDNAIDKHDVRTPNGDQYLARKAKEFVRSRLIGQTVRLVFEYERESLSQATRTQYPTQKFASVYIQHQNTNNNNNKFREENIALSLMKEGLAELIRHSKTQLTRSGDYHSLQVAWEKAKEKRKGIYCSLDDKLKDIKDNAIEDYSLANDKLLYKRVSLNNWLRGNKVRAIVEFIFSANRLKLLIPDKRAAISVMLADIRCGGWSSNNKDEWRIAAKKYLDDTIRQREVLLQITATDLNQTNRNPRMKNKKNKPSDNPNLLGHIYFNDVNVSEYLIKQGWATVIIRRYNKSSGISQRGGPPKNFVILEQQARDANLGVHKEYNNYNNNRREEDEKWNARNAKQLAKNDKTGKIVNIVVSHIETASLFYVNDADVSDDNKNKNKNKNSKKKMNMVEMNKRMIELKNSNQTKHPQKISRGKHYAALYDGFYARARVNNRDRSRDDDNTSTNREDQAWFVMFIDYGNIGKISMKKFASLPADLRTDKIPPLAMRCELAGIRSPDKNENGYYSAGNFFSQQVMNQKLKMKIIHDDQYNKVWYVELFVGNQSINQLLAEQGLVRLQNDKQIPNEFKSKNIKIFKDQDAPNVIEHKTYIKKYFDDLKINIKKAKDAHMNIWKFGDIDSDDDDNLGPNKFMKNKNTKTKRK